MTTWSSPTDYTSQLYPVGVIETMTINGIDLTGAPFYFYIEAINNHAALISGGLFPSLYTYSNWPAEAFQMVGASGPISGTLTPGLYEYTNWPAEAFQQVGVSLVSGSGPTNALITYTNWPTEGFQMVGASLQSGTLV